MEKKKSQRWYKNKEKPKHEIIYNLSSESTLLFKARTDSLEVNEKRKKWGGEKDSCEKCEKHWNMYSQNALSIKVKEYILKHK